MKTFKEFLDESSLSRIKSKSDKGGIAVMSASRAKLSAKENRARAKQLDKDIRAVSYTHLTLPTIPGV